jgi:AcrR family transcriptional regulator
MNSETRQNILAAAEELIREKGQSRVTTKDIARSTGLSEGALYRHFEHKEDVFLAILQKQLPIMGASFDQIVAGSGSLQTNLGEILMAVMTNYEHLIPHSSAFFADSELLTRFRELLVKAGGPQRLFERLGTYIEQEQSLQRINPAMPLQPIVSLLLGSVFQYVYLFKLQGHEPTVEDKRTYVDGLVQVLCAGILPKITPE